MTWRRIGFTQRIDIRNRSAPLSSIVPIQNRGDNEEGWSFLPGKSKTADVSDINSLEALGEIEISDPRALYRVKIRFNRKLNAIIKLF
ncbi:hypothetical protein AVEN_69008-1 [Araneus ventricosus]|uniref:Uncharacterized protein n=1 Tax=Araneus ventricosus TaxID=182803 RepID=A0A4Y2I0P2_ARAVE|nr:hypothetical protein AVEN_69008-1 [Araneus ventricosus]